MRDYLTVADLVAMPHLGLQLVAGGDGAGNTVLWTHTSELEDPGPWLEGGELLIVNGFGIPPDPGNQIDYLARLAHHRLAGLAVSVRAPELTPQMLAEADRLGFPVLRIPRQIPFVELSHLVANASERTAVGRLSRHLRIFETLRLRNSATSNTAEIYSQLEQISGYRLAVVSPAGRPLLREWPWVPEDLVLDRSPASADLKITPGGYVLPLFVANRVTAYLVGKEHPGATPGGLAALQHVSTLAALDAIDDQRRREAVHRRGSQLLAAGLERTLATGELEERFTARGMDSGSGLRLLALGDLAHGEADEIAVRDWLADRQVPHLLLNRGALLAAVGSESENLGRLAEDLGLCIGVSSPAFTVAGLSQMQQQALWCLKLARESRKVTVAFAEHQFGLAQWLNPDVETMEQLARGALAPILQHDAEHGTDLLHTLSVYFHNQGRLRPSAAQLFVHEHTLRYRIERIEQLTGRNLRSYRDAFELWLAVETNSGLAQGPPGSGTQEEPAVPATRPRAPDGSVA